MAGGGGGTNTIEKSAEPWMEQKPYLIEGFKQAEDYLNSDKPQYYPGSTVAQMSGQTEQAMNNIAGFGASQGWMPQYSQAVGNVIDNGGGNAQGMNVLSGQAQNGLPDYGQVSAMQGITQNGAQMAGNPVLQQLAQQGAGPNGGADYLTAAARGDYLTDQNPYTQQVIQNAQALGRSPVDAQFAGMGRYGSGSHVAAIADSANRISTQALMQDYQQERQLQQGAAGQLANYGLGSAQLQGQSAQALNQGNLANAGLQLQGAGALQGAATQDAALRQSAALQMINQGNSDAALRLQAAGMLPTLDNAQINRLNASLQAGQLSDQYQQSLLDDQVNRWNFDQNIDLQKLQNYMALIGGQQYGSTSQTTTPTTGSRALLTGLGGAATGAMLGSMLAGSGGAAAGAGGAAATGAAAGSSVGPWGTAIGAGIGGLLGLLAG